MLPARSGGRGDGEGGKTFDLPKGEATLAELLRPCGTSLILPTLILSLPGRFPKALFEELGPA